MEGNFAQGAFGIIHKVYRIYFGQCLFLKCFLNTTRKTLGAMKYQQLLLAPLGESNSVNRKTLPFFTGIKFCKF